MECLGIFRWGPLGLPQPPTHVLVERFSHEFQIGRSHWSVNEYGKPDCQASKSVAKHLAAINAEAC